MMIDELVEKYVKDKKSKKSTPFDKIRKPTAPPTKKHGDDNRYNRKEKHKQSYD